MAETKTRTRLRRPARIIWAVPVLAVAILLGVLFWRRGPAPAPVAEAPPAAETPAAEPTPPKADQAAGPANVAPERVKTLLEGFSKHPTWRSWLAQDDLVRRWAVVTDNLVEGVSPRKALAFLAPKAPFAVREGQGGTVMDPVASYRRYDFFADAIATIDAGAVARAYAELKGAVEAAYRALGYPQARIDDVTAKALRRIASAPVVEGEVPVKAEKGQYLYADPKLEALPEVEKHLLRMGPRNTKLLQAKAKELLDALKLK